MAASRSRSRAKNQNDFKKKVRAIFLSAQGLPIFLSLIIITVLFVLFRMKTVEMNYKIASIKKDIEKVKIEGKELKAKKAKHLSVKNLRKLARTYNLRQPRKNQIIVIP
ncbi:MAG: hypothetical protein VX341_03645 [Bdellovibrionota bacterium]|nr:hypothetical protein [Bdellovibrionota bacterium]